MTIDYRDLKATSRFDGDEPENLAEPTPALGDELASGTPYAVAFGGQGIAWREALSDLVDGSVVADELAAIVGEAEVLLTPVRDALSIARPAGFDPIGWANVNHEDPEHDRTPDASALSAAAVSMPAVFLTQLGALRALAAEGLDVHEIPPVAAVGHSQGVLAVESLDTFGSADAELLAVAQLIGAAATLVGRRVGLTRAGERSPMRTITGAEKAELEQMLTELFPDRDTEIHRPVLTIRNSIRRHVIVGRTEDLDRFERHCAERESAERGRREAKLTGGDPFAPVFDHLDVEVGFHHPVLAGAVDQVSEWAGRCGIDVDRATTLVRAILTDPVDWVEELGDAVHAGARWVLDLGPGQALNKLNFTVLRGQGVGSLPAATPGGLRNLFTPGAAPTVELPWSAHQPRLILLPDGTTHVETSFTRLTGTSPIMLAGMTPTTVDPAIVAAAANAGHWAELAGGGQVTETIFSANTKRLAELLEPGRTAQFNSLFLDPYLWNMQVGGKRLVQKARAAGIPFDGVVVTAGIPDLDNAVELVDELREAGIRHVSFKPGTVAQIRQVVRIATETPRVPIIVQVEGGCAGGHHSWEALDDLLLATYGELRGRPNIVLAVGGGIGTPERAADYLTGQWSLDHGFPAMPVDAVLVGTAAMATLEATTSPQVKQMLVDTEGVTGWVGAGQASGGMASGRSQLGADIHEIDNAAARTGRLLDEVAGDADAVAKRREEIISAINSTAKPYFGDLDEMTYADVLTRFAAVCAGTPAEAEQTAGVNVFDSGSDFGEAIAKAQNTSWLDVTLRDRFHKLVQRTEARLDPRDTGTIPTQFPTPASVENPDAVLAAITARYPDAVSSTLHPADVAEFLAIFRAPGKPVPFVPTIDADVRRWWRSDSLWQAHDPRYAADEVCIIPGTVSVAGIERADEPVGALLDRFEAAAAQRLSGTQPDIDPVTARRRNTADGPDTLVTATLASPDVLWAGRLVSNPVHRLGEPSRWLLDDGGAAHHPESGSILSEGPGDREVVLTVPVGRSDLSITIDLPAAVASGAVPSISADAAAQSMRTLLRTAAGVDELPPVEAGEAELITWYSPNRRADHTGVTGSWIAPPLAPSAGVPDVLVGSCWPAIFAVIGAASTRAQSPTQADRAIDIVEGLLDLVHLDHGIVTHAALPETSAELRINAKARGVRDTELGRVIEVTVEIATAHDGDRLATLRERFAIRGRTGQAEAGEPNRFGGALVSGDGTTGAKVEETTRQRRANVTFTAPLEMTAFAHVSGDHNPIHVSTTAAKLAGLGDVIVHGMWLSAAAQQAVQASDGTTPSPRIVGWTARMLAPVRPGATINVRAEQTGRVASGPHLGGQVLEVTCNVDGSPAMMATAITAPPRIAYVFPGQGIQSAGMGMEGRNRSRAAREIWDRADEHTRATLGFSILAVVRDNPTEVTVRGTTYRHPDGVLYLTQFTQVAMACLAVAQVAELREDGLFIDGSYFAGHSVGEYTALAAISGTLSLESLLEIVFKRGLAMHTLVPRDAEGNSNYRLAAIRPSQMGVADADVADWVARVSEESGEFLQIVNYNLAGSQYAIAGTVAGCEALESAVTTAVERHGGKAAFVLVPGIDVPFHSQVLRDGVPEFRATLDSLIPHEIDIDVLVGRYIPNLVPRLFSLDRDFVAEIADYVESATLDNVLDSWDDWAAQPNALGRLLLIELLAWQFASPVRWIETQDLMFDAADNGGLGIEQCLEVGVASAPTLANLAAKTLALPQHEGSALTQVLNIERDAATLWGTLPPSIDDEDEGDTEVEGARDAESAADAAPSEAPPATTTPAAPQAAADAPRPDDIAFDAGAATKLIVALRTKIRPDQITGSDSIETLCDGVSSRRNQLLVDLGSELGLGAIDGAAEAEFTDLTSTVGRMARAYRAFGPVLTDAIGDSLRPVLGRSGKRQSYIADRVKNTWQLGEGWTDHVIAQIALGTREGASTRGGDLALFDAASASDAAGLDSLIDSAVTAVGSENGVSVTMPASETGGAATIDAAALGEFTEQITGRDGALVAAARTLLAKLGHLDTQTVDLLSGGEGSAADADAELAELVTAELGSDWRRTIAPAFDARRAVLLDDRWATAREDLARIWAGELAVCPDSFAGAGTIVAAQSTWWSDQAAAAGREDLAGAYEEIAGYAADASAGKYADQVAVVTGAGPGSIASAVIGDLLAGGATVVATTSNLSDKRLAFYKDLYRDHARGAAALWVAPANLASFGDVDALIRWIGEEQSVTMGGATELIKPALTPTLLFPFAAPRVQGSAADAGPRAETEMRVLLWGVERLVTGLGELGADTNTDATMHVVLPGSPNRGLFGGDGAYGEAKAALDALVAKWGSEKAWSSRVTFAHAFIGWVRGTGLMGHNDPLVAEVEAAGVRTWSTEEMAAELLAGCTPEAREQAAISPLRLDLTGGLGEANIDMAALAEGRTAPTAPEDSADSAGTLSALPNLPRVLPDARPDWGTVEADLEDMVVVVGTGELGPYGSARTRFEAELSGELSAAGIVELAWSTGIIAWEDGPKPGWMLTETSEPIAESDIAEQLREEVMARVGIRRYADDGEMLSGTSPALSSVFLDEDLSFVASDEAEARAYAEADPDNTAVEFDAEAGEWTVTRKAGTEIRVPRRTTLTRVVGGQIPTGFDPAAWGIPAEMVDSIDRVAAWNLVATVDAFLSSGFTPAELLANVHPADVANTQGTGMGGMSAMRSLYIDGILGRPRQGDILQEALPNVVAAHVMQSYVGGYGSMVHPVAACATAAVSVEEGFDKIRGGKAEFVVAGGFDDLSIEGIQGFADMSATADSAEMASKGIDERYYSRAGDRRRGGFVESQGGGTILLARGDVAAELGLPVHGVIAWAASYADGAHTSIPAPGLGALGAGRGGSRSQLARNLAKLGMTADDLAFVSKHDTSTKANDPNEADLHERLAEALGRTAGNPLFVVSQKTLTGHSKGGAAAFQLIGLCQVLRSGVLPPNRSLDCLDDAMSGAEHLVWPRQPLRLGESMPLRGALLTSLGFGHVSGLIAIAHPEAYYRAVEVQRGSETAEAARERAAMREREGAWTRVRGIYGGAPLYERPVARRLGEGSAAEIKDLEAAMLLSPDSRADADGVLSASGGLIGRHSVGQE